MLGWGWWKAMAVVGKTCEEFRPQMGSNEVLLCLKHHKK